jgi:hypothetical protein
MQRLSEGFFVKSPGFFEARQQWLFMCHNRTLALQQICCPCVMSKKLAVIVMALWVVGVLGFLIGVSMQVSFEHTSDSYAQQEFGKIVIILSLFLIAMGWMLKKINDTK